jgi:hypothetical protein
MNSLTIQQIFDLGPPCGRYSNGHTLDLLTDPVTDPARRHELIKPKCVCELGLAGAICAPDAIWLLIRMMNPDERHRFAWGCAWRAQMRADRYAINAASAADGYAADSEAHKLNNADANAAFATDAAAAFAAYTCPNSRAERDGQFMAVLAMIEADHD